MVTDTRKSDLAKIHMAKAALGWDDGFYRQVLWTVCHVESSAQLDHAGRQRLLAHMRSCGWADKAPSKSRPVRKPLTPKQRLMWSLWQRLADAGLVRDRKMTALLSYAKRITGVDLLDWMMAPQEDLLIETLKRWLERGEEAS